MLALVPAACGDDTGLNVHLTSMQLSPPMAIVAVGKTKRLISELVDDRGERFDVSNSATWASDNTAVATASTGGSIKGVAPGACQVSASRDGLTGSAQIMVVSTMVTSIAVTPAPVVLAPGGHAQLTATATLMDGSMVDVTSSATWASDNLAAVTVAGGLLTGVTFGQATVVATSDAIQSNGVRVTVGNPPDGGVDAPPDAAGADAE